VFKQVFFHSCGQAKLRFSGYRKVELQNKNKRLLSWCDEFESQVHIQSHVQCQNRFWEIKSFPDETPTGQLSVPLCGSLD